MRNSVKKVIAFIVTLCICLTCMPVTNASAAAEASVTLNNDVSETSIYTDQTVEVNIRVRGIPGTINVIPTDVVLILDQSGSMSGTKIETLKNAAINFIKSVDYNYHRVGLISYGSSVTNNISFTTDEETLVQTVESISANGGTYIGTAISAANEMMDSNKRDGAKPVIVIVTDGEAADESAARNAAETAKSKGFIFYTIALFENAENAEQSGTTEYKANELLKDMATTAIHHHFVGETGLARAYEDIAGDIGIENPYNVKITQQISDEFEYVIGSADSNVPQPTISGNTLTWEMLELKDQVLRLSYEIKPKAGCTAGTYPVTSLGTVEYETFSGDVKTIEIVPEDVTVKEIPELTNASMTPTSGQEGNSVRVTVSATGLYYGTGFKVMLGNQEMETTLQKEGYFRFNTPKDLAVGTYDVTVYNGDGSKGVVVGQYTCEQIPAIVVTEMTPLSVEEGKSPTITAYVETQPLYQDDFTITVGGVEAVVKSKSAGYTKFRMPNTLAPGEYEVVITNGGRTTVVSDKITVTEPEGEKPIEVTEMTPLSVEEGKSTTITAYVATQPTYQSDFSVTVGGVEAKVKSKSASYIKFVMPSTLTAGEYEVVITNGGNVTTVSDKITVEAPTAEPPIVVTEMTPLDVEIGKSVTITAYVETQPTYQSDFSVTVGGVEATIKSKSASYIKFVMPNTLTAGEYEVVITNGGTTTTVTDQITVSEPAPAPGIVVTEITPNSATAGRGTTITAYVETKPTYESDFTVTVGGVEAKVKSKSAGYFKFIAPKTLTAGTYNVVVTNGGTTSVVGTLTIN